MKRYLALVIVTAALVSAKAFAVDAGDEIEHILREGRLTRERRERILARSAHIDALARATIYENNKKKNEIALVATFVNIAPFGVGSYIQGDWVGGLITTGAHFCGATLAGAGFGLLIPATLLYNADKNNEQIRKQYTATIAMITSGCAVIGVAYLFSFIRPWLFMTSYNGKLKDALQASTRTVNAEALAVHMRPLTETYVRFSMFQKAF